MNKKLIDWLLEGDVAIQYQVHRDLLSVEREDLRKRIAEEGWGARFLSKRRPDGHWGQKFYQPKWTSSHYTLLDLRNLCIAPDHPFIQASLDQILATEKGRDGGVRPIGATQVSDVCLNGMFLNYASYFKAEAQDLESIVDFLLSQRMPDGGFNCRSNRSGAVHSSFAFDLVRTGRDHRIRSQWLSLPIGRVEKSQTLVYWIHPSTSIIPLRQNGRHHSQRFSPAKLPFPLAIRYPQSPGLLSIFRHPMGSPNAAGHRSLTEEKK